MKKIRISIDKERPNIISSEDKNTAKNESDKIVAVDYVQKLADSKDETTLFLDKVYRFTIGSFCLIGVAIVIFVVLAILYLCFHYITTLPSLFSLYYYPPIRHFKTRNEMFLLNVWKTVSSATVPLVPFLVWVIKTKQFCSVC